MLVTLAAPTRQINKCAKDHPLSATSTTSANDDVVNQSDGQHLSHGRVCDHALVECQKSRSGMRRPNRSSAPL